MKTANNQPLSTIGLGCWAIGGAFWEGDSPLGWGDVDDAESIRAIQLGLEGGINLFDTAAIYGAGHSERVLSKAVGDRRNDIFVVSKFGFQFEEATRQVTGADASPEQIIQDCEASLKRLNSDFIDLYLLHLNEHPVEQWAEVADTLQTLKSQGKVRYFGWSTDYAENLATGLKSDGFTAVETEINLLNDNAEILNLCEDNDIRCLNRGPLAMGLLSGKYQRDDKLGNKDIRSSNPGWLKYYKDGSPSTDMLDRFDTVREILTQGGRTPVQGALAWLLARSPNNTPIPGFRTEKQVLELAKTIELGALAPAQMKEIAKLLKA